VEPRYRLGILTTELQDKIVGSRELFYTELPAHLRELIERYDPDKYVSVATLRENIVFGKLSNRNADGVAELRALAAKVSQELGFSDQLVRAGLDYDIGAGGRRLTPVQRRKLNLARALLRRSDYYVFNKPLPGLERHAQEEIVQNVLAFLRQQENDPAVIWVLSNISLSRLFDRVVMFDGGAILEEGSYETLEQESGTFKALVA
jgi:putative ABC transport system ATP-binding protein